MAKLRTGVFVAILSIANGLTFLGCWIWIYTEIGSLSSWQESGFHLLFIQCSLLVIFASMAVFLIKSRKTRLVYYQLCIVGLIATFGIGIFQSFAFLRPPSEYEMQTHLKSFFPNATIPLIFDMIQHENECCGIKAPDDYKDFHSTYSINSSTIIFNVPDSCCKLEYEGCGYKRSMKSAEIYSAGCFDGTFSPPPFFYMIFIPPLLISINTFALLFLFFFYYHKYGAVALITTIQSSRLYQGIAESSGNRQYEDHVELIKLVENKEEILEVDRASCSTNTVSCNIQLDGSTVARDENQNSNQAQAYEIPQPYYEGQNVRIVNANAHSVIYPLPSFEHFGLEPLDPLDQTDSSETSNQQLDEI